MAHCGPELSAIDPSAAGSLVDRSESVVLRAPAAYCGPPFPDRLALSAGRAALSIACPDSSLFPSPVSPDSASFPALAAFSLICNYDVVLGLNYSMLLGCRGARSFSPLGAFSLARLHPLV
jgi:hypothetical protein